MLIVWLTLVFAATVENYQSNNGLIAVNAPPAYPAQAVRS
jgi:hypothetical protein